MGAAFDKIAAGLREALAHARSFPADEMGRSAAFHFHHTGPSQKGVSPMATVTKIAPERQVQAGTVSWLNDCIERSKAEKFTTTVILTPGLAEVLLARNPKNRNFKQIKIAQYIDDVRHGRWRHSMESVKIHRDGWLADGQHRCRAVAETKISITTEMAFGVDDADIETMDIGATRTAGDFAKMDGVADPMLAAAIARLIIAYEREGGRTLGKSSTITTPSVLDRIGSDRWIAPAAQFASKNRSKIPGIPGSVIGFCWYLFASIHPADAEEYLSQIANGAGLQEGDPALTIRDYLIRRTRAAGVGRERKIEAIMRGWNAFRDGRPLRSVSTGHARFSGFPELA